MENVTFYDFITFVIDFVGVIRRHLISFPMVMVYSCIFVTHITKWNNCQMTKKITPKSRNF